MVSRWFMVMNNIWRKTPSLRLICWKGVSSILFSWESENLILSCTTTSTTNKSTTLKRSMTTGLSTRKFISIDRWDSLVFQSLWKKTSQLAISQARTVKLQWIKLWRLTQTLEGESIITSLHFQPSQESGKTIAHSYKTSASLSRSETKISIVWTLLRLFSTLT